MPRPLLACPQLSCKGIFVLTKDGIRTLRRVAIATVALGTILGALALTWCFVSPDVVRQVSTPSLALVLALALLPLGALAAWQLDRTSTRAAPVASAAAEPVSPAPSLAAPTPKPAASANSVAAPRSRPAVRPGDDPAPPRPGPKALPVQRRASEDVAAQRLHRRHAPRRR